MAWFKDYNALMKTFFSPYEEKMIGNVTSRRNVTKKKWAILNIIYLQNHGHPVVIWKYESQRFLIIYLSFNQEVFAVWDILSCLQWWPCVIRLTWLLWKKLVILLWSWLNIVLLNLDYRRWYYYSTVLFQSTSSFKVYRLQPIFCSICIDFVPVRSLIFTLWSCVSHHHE